MEAKEVKGKIEKDRVKKVQQHACKEYIHRLFIILGWNKKRQNLQRHKMDTSKIKNQQNFKGWGGKANESRYFIQGQVSQWYYAHFNSKKKSEEV